MAKLSPPSARRYEFDNLRGCLILLVVAAHLMERFASFPGSEDIYRIIYSFHMPAFLFLFGYFATFKPFRIGWQILMYLLFQSLYLLFARYVLDTKAAWQYSTPYWLLWYLLTGIYYQLLIPLYNRKSPVSQGVVFAFSIILSLVAGYFPTIGYQWSLSRFFVFQPFFIAGLFYRRHELCLQKPFTKGRLWWRLAGCLLPMAACVCLLASDVSRNMLYGSYAYAKTGSTIWGRTMLLLIGFAWIVFLLGSLGFILNRKLPLLTTLGQNTLPVFLLHGFVVRAIPRFFPQWLRNPILILPLTLGILFLFGNPWVGKAFRLFFDPPFLKKKMHT